jgi:hypothetical protein
MTATAQPRERLRLSIEWPATRHELDLLAGTLVDRLPDDDVAYLAWRLAELAYFHRLTGAQ